MAKATGLSRMTISRILLIEKVRDIVGLYMNPPDHALVLCVDEKTQIQALDRTQPLLPMRPGQLERRTHDDKRHGTTSLFAALELKTSKVVAQLKHRHRSVEFRQFLDLIEAQVPAGLEVHIIVDKLWNPQNGSHSEMVCQTPTLSCPLHSHLRILDQPGGALVRRTHQQANSAGRVPQRERTGSRHP